MDTCVLFSHKKGFWSSDKGWTPYIQIAEKYPRDATFQLNFRNSYHVGLFPTSEMLHLTIPQAVIHYLAYIYDIDDKTRRIALQKMGLKFEKNKHQSQEDWVKYTFMNVDFDKIDMDVLRTSISTYTDYLCALGATDEMLILIPKEEAIETEKAPLIAPYMPEKHQVRRYKNRR